MKPCNSLKLLPALFFYSLIGIGVFFVGTKAYAKNTEYFQVMLAKKYTNQSVSGWLASEKLDGVRGYWNGSQMMSRNGNPYPAPQQFIENFPDFPLDGELYSQRGEFAMLSGLVRSGKDWSKIKYYVFDVPMAKGGLLQRLEKIQRWLKHNPNPNIVIIPQRKVKNFAEALAMRQAIEQGGGEGVILRDPDSPYLSKRTNTMLKLKKDDDAECIVTQYLAGKGKYRGQMGAILCRLPNGQSIKIGSGFNDSERIHPPAIGSTITYRYNGLTKNGKPRFPRFWRIRKDKPDSGNEIVSKKLKIKQIRKEK